MRKARLWLPSRLSKLIDDPGDAPRASDAGISGDRAVYFRAVRQIRRSLAARGLGGWVLAEIDGLDEVGPALVRDFVAKRLGTVETCGLDMESGTETAPMLSWRWYERDLAPWDGAWFSNEIAFFCFSLLENYGGHSHFRLAAAPDEARLLAILREFDDFRASQRRSSDEILVIGGHRVPVEKGASWDDLVLPAAQKSDIRRNVEAFFRGKAAYDRLRMPWKRGMLFTGPPGNGKTTLCRTIAAQSGVPTLYLLLGSSEERTDPIGQMFRRARAHAPCVMVFEDIDSLVRGPGEMSYFLNLMDGLVPTAGVLVIATTNHPEEIDPALLDRPSRFDRVWTIGNPEAPERRAYLSRLFAGNPAESAVERLVAETAGLPGAYLKELYLSAAQEALLENLDAPSPVILEAHVDVALARLLGQRSSAKDRFVERIPLGFHRERDEA